MKVFGSDPADLGEALPVLDLVPLTVFSFGSCGNRQEGATQFRPPEPPTDYCAAHIVRTASRGRREALDVLVAQAAAQRRRDARNQGTDKHR
jgi:hypothetical protein